jgi:predicted RNA-binding protein with EMAP domain
VDTANDYRILVAEKALEILEKRIKSWSLPWPIRKREILDIINNIRRDLLRIKYSFLPSEILVESEETKRIVSASKLLMQSLLNKEVTKGFQIKSIGQKLALAEIKYSISVLLGLPKRMALGDENVPEYAVDVMGAEVTRMDKLTEKLKVTRASVGTFALTVVTNLEDIKVGQVRAVAILPPMEFHGIISEGMYSSGPLEDKYIGKRVPSKFLSNELRAKVLEIVRKKP